ncbi:MAG: hypothetical protein MN733_30530, partial [Nitrososphaera sp.]|nr:hypothetical protein [Nitrososphaera sp.]
KTERAFLGNLMMELVDLVKFNSRSPEQKTNASAIFVAGSEDRALLAKSAAVAFQVLGWDSLYIGDVEEQIDPFFDIDFQRYVSRVWAERHGIMIICIFSSGEGSLKFLSSAARALKGRMKGELRLAVYATQELQQAAEESSDFSAKDLLSLVEWAEREYTVMTG